MADLGLIPGLGRSPGEEKGYPLQYSGLEKSMDSIVHGVPKSWTQLSDFGGSDRKASACNVGDLGLIHGSGRSSGERNGNLLQYSCLVSPIDREAWQVTVHEVAKESDTTWQLNNTKYISQT